MKVLLINGSPRRNGNTDLALTEIQKTLAEQGIDSEIQWIGVKPIRSCIACGQCKVRGMGHCVFADDICNAVIDKLNESDALIVGSPTYYGTPNGAVLSLLHRMFYAGAQVANKPAAAVIVCRRGGATAAFQTLQMPFQMLNMPLVTSQYWNIVYGREEGEAVLDLEGMQTMRQLARNMAWLLKSIHTAGDTNAQTPLPLPEHEQWQGYHFIRP